MDKRLEPHKTVASAQIGSPRSPDFSNADLRVE
jgi:hypothetical protein